MPSHLFSPPLISSNLFSYLLTWSQLLSARFTSSQLFSAHSQVILFFLWPKPAPKTGSWHLSKQSLDFSDRRFDTEKLLHTASFYTERLEHTEAFTQNWGNLSSQSETITHNKISHRESFAHRSFYTQQTCTHSQLLHRKAFAHRSFDTQQAFTQRSPNIEKHYIEELLYTEAFTYISFYTQQSFIQRSPITDKHLHRGTFTHRSLCAQKLLHTAIFYRHKHFYTQQTFTQRSF